VIVAEVEDVTDVVVTVNAVVVLPAATLTEAGTLADVLLLARATAIPPVGAALLKVTVPVAEAPPLTLVGLSATEERAALTAGVIVSVAVLLTLL
jgi:hypothetical protein